MGCGFVEEFFEGVVVVVDLLVGVFDVSGQGTHRVAGTSLIDRAGWVVTDTGAALHESGSAKQAKLTAELIIGGDDECFQLVDRRSASRSYGAANAGGGSF